MRSKIMTREEAKEVLPIMQAYVEGKTIQLKGLDGTWNDLEDPNFIGFNREYYRIKPEEVCVETTTCEEEHYRPFNDCGELVDCWKKKMYVPAFYYTKDFRDKLSRPDIWVKSKEYGTENLITAFDGNNESIGGSCVFIQDIWIDMKELFDSFTFCDSSPCGVEE